MIFSRTRITASSITLYPECTGYGSHMDGAFADRKRGLLDGFRAGRMGMTRARQIVRRTAKLHQNAGFVDHFAGFAADDVHAKHAIGLRICENLHKAVSGLVDLGAAVGGERKFSGGVGDTGLLQLFLGLADRRHFRRGIHDAWNNIVIHVAGLTGDDLGTGDAFILGLVREHRPCHHIADRIDALHAGREMRVDLHAAAIVERDAGLLEAEPFGVGHATDTDQHHVGFERLSRSAGCRFDTGLQHFARCIDAGDLGAELERKALLFEHALELFSHFAIHAGQDAVEEFDDHDLRPQPAPHRAEFEADHTGADDQHSFRHFFQRERAGRRHDALFVDLDAFQPCDIGAGGDDDVPGLNRLGLAVATDFYLAGPEDLAGAHQHVDLVLLHQELDTLDVAVDALLLEVHHRRQIEFRRGNADAHLGKGVRVLLEHFAGMQQRLRRHAADIEAGATESRVLLDHGDLHAELRRAHRADISARAGADDDEIVGSHDEVL